ncbi:hypothetical protein TNCV_3677851 [Trichonephila clavipes]|nr:hypothetical protein TNCV_3677851 [Trichonephila clavipes]
MNEFTVKDVRVNKKPWLDWYMFSREVCMFEGLKESEPHGGEGKIVEIDESMFGKMKYLGVYLHGLDTRVHVDSIAQPEPPSVRVRFGLSTFLFRSSPPSSNGGGGRDW